VDAAPANMAALWQNIVKVGRRIGGCNYQVIWKQSGRVSGSGKNQRLENQRFSRWLYRNCQHFDDNLEAHDARFKARFAISTPQLGFFDRDGPLQTIW
jgi:hypothetical protein